MFMSTVKGWTVAEETTFADIMRIARMERMPAIHIYRRCGSDPVKAIQLAQENHGLSDEQTAAYERNKAARLAGLAKARQDRSIQLSEAHA
jgi:hypothetical protein